MTVAGGIAGHWMLLLVATVAGVSAKVVETIFESISEVSAAAAAVAVEEGHQQALRQIIEIHDSQCGVACQW